MHVNWQNGETRAFARKHRNQGHHWYRDPWWLESSTKRRVVRQSVTIESCYEEAWHHKRARSKKFRLEYKGGWFGRNKWRTSWPGYETKKAQEMALKHLNGRGVRDPWKSNERYRIAGG